MMDAVAFFRVHVLLKRRSTISRRSISGQKRNPQSIVSLSLLKSCHKDGVVRNGRSQPCDTRGFERVE